jgi:hypothetical protein
MYTDKLIEALNDILLNESDSVIIHSMCEPLLVELYIINSVSFDQIDKLLEIADTLYLSELFDTFSSFIMACPHNFIITYANNTEKIPEILITLYENKYYAVYTYIHKHIQKTQLLTIKERYSYGVFCVNKNGEDDRLFF